VRASPTPVRALEARDDDDDAREAALARACVLARAVDDMVSETTTTRALVCGESTQEAARSSANARSEPR
jgi:hypothetical protein|tara:strand:+ start:14850 stop:15059 length:210 start_codon:yes stop_codon:yes gene_type:complete